MNLTAKQTTYNLIDILKLFFSIAIVIMHLHMFEGNPLEPFITPLICQVGVPFFFVASGFFVAERFTDSGGGLEIEGGVLV